MTISVTLTTPSRSSSPQTFANDVDTFLGQLPAWTSQANTTAADINVQADSALDSAVSAQNSALSAAASAGAPVWVSGSTGSIGDARYSPLNGAIYRRKNLGAFVVDPSLDAVNWGSPIEPIVTPTTTAMVVISLNQSFGVL